MVYEKVELLKILKKIRISKDFPSANVWMKMCFTLGHFILVATVTLGGIPWPKQAHIYMHSLEFLTITIQSKSCLSSIVSMLVLWDIL